jgi:hypothetical protein
MFALSTTFARKRLYGLGRVYLLFRAQGYSAMLCLSKED